MQNPLSRESPMRCESEPYESADAVVLAFSLNRGAITSRHAPIAICFGNALQRPLWSMTRRIPKTVVFGAGATAYAKPLSHTNHAVLKPVSQTTARSPVNSLSSGTGVERLIHLGVSSLPQKCASS